MECHCQDFVAFARISWHSNLLTMVPKRPEGSLFDRGLIHPSSTRTTTILWTPKTHGKMKVLSPKSMGPITITPTKWRKPWVFVTWITSHHPRHSIYIWYIYLHFTIKMSHSCRYINIPYTYIHWVFGHGCNEIPCAQGISVICWPDSNHRAWVISVIAAADFWEKCCWRCRGIGEGRRSMP